MIRKHVLSLSLLLSAMAAAAHAETQARSGAETLAQMSAPASVQPNKDSSIRPFRVHVPEDGSPTSAAASRATRWPDKETVNDRSQGAQLAKLQELVRYWGTDYDWRKAEAKLNALPQFMTKIDGVDIHFIHVRSQHPNALPVIITHGWPGSVFEQIKIIGPLTDPTAHGGRAEDAFDVVIPSMPGYGFSGRPTGTGWGPDHIARAWAELMKRLGYTRYVAQGGDWGAPVSERDGAPGAGRLARHPHQLAGDGPARGRRGARRRRAGAGGTLRQGTRGIRRADSVPQERRLAYVAMMGARPQAVGYGMTDSPAGLAAWMLVHPGFAQWTYGEDPNSRRRKTTCWTTSRCTG